MKPSLTILLGFALLYPAYGPDEVDSTIFILEDYMFFSIGTPKRLNSKILECPDISILKRKLHIAVIDDEPFHRLDALRTHGFNLTHLDDIKSIDQVDAYPIVICDIKGVGKAFGSEYEGAHVLSEIRKSYPDKYLISFSGATFDASYNASFATADKSVTKDVTVDQWVTLLEEGPESVFEFRLLIITT